MSFVIIGRVRDDLSSEMHVDVDTIDPEVETTFNTSYVRFDVTERMHGHKTVPSSSQMPLE